MKQQLNEEYTEEDWLSDLYNSSESSRTVVVARTSLKTFDIFCQSQGLARDEMIQKYQRWFKPVKDEHGEKPEPDIQSICISLGKFCKFMNEPHEGIQISRRATFKKKSPKSIKLYFVFIKSYLRKCHGIRLTVDDVKDFIVFPKTRKDQRQPISLEQLKMIMTNASPKRRALYYVLVSSGMRLGEALTLTKKNFRFNERPVRVILEAENTKTKESRETYVSGEAVEKLKQILGDVINHKEDCKCLECNKMFFAWSDDNTNNVSYEDQYFIHLRQKLGLTKKYPNSIRYVINLHSMRAYFITKASQKHGSDYGHALSGHGSYLKEYIRIPKEEQAKLYLELEPDLLIESMPVESSRTKDVIIENLQELLGKKYSQKIELFKRLRIQAMGQGRFSFPLGKNNSFTYTSFDPHLPYLFSNGDFCRFVVSPLRTWIQEDCQVCNPVIESTKTNIEEFVNDYSKKFGRGVAKRAVELKLLQHGIATQPKRVLQAQQYIERFLCMKKINLEELAEKYGLQERTTKLFPDKQPEIMP